jgi:hypothetical protein
VASLIMVELLPLIAINSCAPPLIL